MPAVTFENTVGPMKLPFSKPLTFTARPSSSSTAPSPMPSSIRPRMRLRADLEITGPKSAPFSVPALTLSVRALATMSGIQPRASPTRTVTEVAMQRCPAAPKVAPTRAFKDCSLFASGRTTA